MNCKDETGSDSGLISGGILGFAKIVQKPSVRITEVSSVLVTEQYIYPV
jgi:hypothetical protein